MSGNNLERAERLLETGRFDEVIDICRQHEEDYRAHYFLGTAIFRKNVDGLDYTTIDEAIRHYDRSLEINPRFADAYFLRGIAHEKRAELLEKEYLRNKSPELKEMVVRSLQIAKDDLTNAKNLEYGFAKVANDHLSILLRSLNRLSASIE